MKIHHRHPWQLSIEKAREIQNRLRRNVILKSGLSIQSIKLIAAADVSYSRRNKKLFAAVVLFSFPKLQLVSGNAIEYLEKFPYVPGYLSFREIPPLISVFEKLHEDIDVILCDAHGIAHPRRFGLSSHLGVLLDKPTIGCAKSRLIGDYEEPSSEKGSYSSLYDRDEKIGLVLRTRPNVQPLFISPGHKIDFEDCRTIVLNCLGKYRIPEPLRYAHQYVNQVRTKIKG